MQTNKAKSIITFHGFELDKFQIEAIDAIKANHSVLVAAPTGAGKTIIAEYAIEQSLIEGKKIIYTAPIKALSNQKYREFQEIFPDMVGIITGDVSINTNAPLLIMTTEIFKNRILEDNHSFEDYTMIIFDEIHYLDDISRGTVWEESLIFMPKHFRFIGLSATIPNINEFANWIRSIHSNEVKVVIETKRPIPLTYYYYCCGKITGDLNKLKKYGYIKKDNYLSKEDYYNLKDEFKNSYSKTAKLLRTLKKKERTPVIYFTFSRKRAEELAKSNSVINFFNNSDDQKEALQYFDYLCNKFDISDSERIINLRKLIKNGVAYHHAGILPIQKEVIEQLFSKKLIRVIFTTETFALGINMPARSVVIDELKKRYDRSFRLIKTRDFLQMSGRAGRRGIDLRGYVYSFVNPFNIAFDELYRLDTGNPEPIISKFNATFSTILNLYETYGDKLLDIYKLSFHHFQTKNSKSSIRYNQMKSRLNILKELGYITNNKLTSKGEFAKVVHGYGLILSELYDEGILETLDYKEMAILILSIVFEPKPGTRMPHLSENYKNIRFHTSETINRIHRAEKRYGIKELSKRCYYDLSAPLSEWMRERPFEEIIVMIKIDEGALIRYYRMGIQLMRELLRTPVSDTVKENTNTAIALINHGVIDAENQLKSIIDTLKTKDEENNDK